MQMLQHEEQTRSTLTDPLRFAIQIGFFAGLIWGGIRWVFYIFQFTTITPGYLAEPFYKHSYLMTMRGQMVGWVYFILLSILATMIYTLCLRKLKGPWPGIGYGIVWWVILYGFIGPMMHMMPMLTKLSRTTILTEFCLFLIWGLFIGYTVAVEYTDERGREPGHAKKGQDHQNVGHNPQPEGATNS
ncbi:YqhR family membrane protein [Paenibacillus sp. GCM10027629]|uniref:YqhR family membrane protein n=1 Tax=Paenibacillus sp. GCM10027629 TaxID=3273414 RepID=UPI00363CAB7B